MERNDAKVDFNFGTTPPGSNMCGTDYGVNWTGYVNLTSSGNWRFGATSDDGFAIDIETTPGNWVQVFSDWSIHAPRTRWGSFVNLSSGWYGIRVWYFQGPPTQAVAQLRFEGPGTAAQIVPPARLRTCSAPTGIIQGQKNLMPDNSPASPASEQTVFLDGGSSTTANPYSYTTSTGSHTVSVTAPGGYMVQSTLCRNRTDCHTQACVNNDAGCPVAGAGANGSSRTVNVPSGGYADLYWHYTLVNPWVGVTNGLIYANHLVGLRPAPSGQFNSRWTIFSRGSVTGTSQEGWTAPWYPERNFDLTQNTPIEAPDYAALFKRFGKGATTYSGPTLPSGDGVYLIPGDKTVNGVFNLPANRETLVFVDGDLTVDAEIRIPSSSVLAFIVSGEIKFAKNLTGGGGGVDNLGGLYVASGRINTAYDKSAPDEVTRQLLLEGGLISLADTIALDRNLSADDNFTDPAEQINLSAKYYVRMKLFLGRPKFFYREVPGGF